MAAKFGPTPLLCADAVVLDIETTGLDLRSARLLQIGAVTLVEGRNGKPEELAILVDPGVPIPGAATAIHGIADHDVRGAADPARALAEFTRFLGGRPVIGHSVGFDLAVLAAEARRLGKPPLACEFLDTRRLAEIVAPSLPDFTLETLCAWLELVPEGRHTAIGDARTTASIFRKLLPRLRRCGIRSWAEAVAASRNIGQPALLDAAWAEPPQPRGLEEETALARIDAYPYRHRVREVMTSPPVSLSGDRPLSEAVRLMSERRVSSVLVLGPGGFGIVTERDVLRVVAANSADTLDTPVESVASRPLQTVSVESFIYRAIGRMARLKVRHLGVVDAGGELVGALSARDLLRLRASEAVQLGDAIETAEDVKALAAAWAPLPLVAEGLLAEDIDAVNIAAVISGELAGATRRAAELAEASLRAEGEARPEPYAVLVLGSAGRGESLLALDQDNAIVFRSGEPDGPQDRYFARLGARIADTLDAIGIPYCKGGVMAREPAWRGSLETWRARVAKWLSRSSPEDLLSVDIFFDGEAVYGDMPLADAVLGEAHSEASRAPHFVKLLASASPNPPSPFGLFGGLSTAGGRIDLKRAALLPIVTTARVLAMRHGIAARSTQERLRRLAELGKGGADLEAIMSAHRVVVTAILRQQVRDIHAGVAPSSRVEIASLPRRDREQLRAALKVVPRVDDLVRNLLF